MNRSAPSPSRPWISVFLLPAVLLTASSAFAAGTDPIARSREVLAAVTRAYAAEDADSLLGLMDPKAEGFEAYSRGLRTLFREGNYFEARYDDVHLVEEGNGVVRGNALFTLRYRKVGQRTPEAVRTRVALGFGPSPGGELKLAMHRVIPDPALPEDGAFRATRYSLRVRLRPEAEAVEVEGEVSLRNVSVATADRIAFLLDGFAEDLELSLPGGAQPDARVLRGSVVYGDLRLPDAVPPGGSATLDFRYRLTGMPPTGEHSILPDEVTFAYGTPWIPTFHISAEVQDPSFDYDLAVTVPSGWSAISSGSLTGTEDAGEGRRTFHWSTFAPTSEVFLLAGPLQEVPLSEAAPAADPGPVRIRYWRPVGEAGGPGEARTLTAVASAYRVLATRLGAPPHPEVQLVSSSRLQLYGAAQVIAFDRSWLVNAPAFDAGYMEVIGHQAGHAWFVQGVRTAGPGAPLAREGPSELAAGLVVRETVSEEAFERMLRQRLESFLLMPAPPQPLGLLDQASTAGVEVNKTKGVLLFNELRNLLGEGTLLEGLSAYVHANQGKVASIWDLQASLETAAADQGLDPDATVGLFFSEYVFANSLPDPRIEGLESSPQENGWRTVVRVSNPAEGRARVPVEVETRSEALREVLVLEGGGSGSLEFHTREPIQRVVLDPSGTLFEANRANDYYPSPPGRSPRARSFGAVTVPGKDVRKILKGRSGRKD